MKEIIGNDFYISIAWYAKSPTAAANTAQLSGCTPEQIRAIRNAAKVKRDLGETEFTKRYAPFNLVDVDVKVYKSMKLQISIDKLYEQRGVNGAEFNELADLIEGAIAGTKFKVNIKRQKYKGHVKA